ncbi:MAG: hypothetical protein DRR08_21240 [Candidatus Parabeggiatoa sp. nov. 2]|jgi:hypothetical protein|nr:MAG: hypothetical protein B6247_12325 [Beggiatoa sp. 4572_84]RKZ56616.1 MAG: hypothetical protein DRR08_21240 [Gammaproteobacteria bacterium]
MKTNVDMSPEAIEYRLREVEKLRRLCLFLADSDVGRKIRKTNPENEASKRVALALGEISP